jgi:hypothetical protein
VADTYSARIPENDPRGSFVGDARLRSQEEVVRGADAFFGGRSSVHRTLERLVRHFRDLGVDYAVCGALAVNHYARPRMTVDVDVLVTEEGLERFKRAFVGRGYVEKFPGSRGLRDTETGVVVDFLVAGGFPGDGRPKPVRFPDPKEASVQGEIARVLSLPRLIELKLASGTSAADRPVDLGDVINLIRAQGLAIDFAESLDPTVREAFRDLWRRAQTRESAEEPGTA